MLEQIRKASVTIYILRHPVEAHIGTMKVELAADGQQAITQAAAKYDDALVRHAHVGIARDEQGTRRVATVGARLAMR